MPIAAARMAAQGTTARPLSALAFAQRHLGQRVTAPGGLGGQCVDLADLWLIEGRGGQPVRLNAKDWVGARIPGLKFTANTATNVPPRGALVVWGPAPEVGIGEFGHIALNLTADAMVLCSCDQNWGAELVSLELHSYHGVLGWLAPG